MIGILAFVTLPTWVAILWRKYFARPAPVSNPLDSPRSILLIRLDQLGDMVLTTPIFRELKRIFPEARITLVAPPEYKSIFTTNRHIDEILSLDHVGVSWLPRRFRQLISALWFYRMKLRHRQFDLAISPRWDVDENYATLICTLADAKRRVGRGAQDSPAKRKLNRWFDKAFDVIVPQAELRHEVDRNLAVVETLGGGVRCRDLEIRLTSGDRNFAAELLKHHDGRRLLVAIGIGGRAASRRWPLQRYAETIAALNRLFAVQPVIVCSEEENADASKLSVMLSVPPYIVSGLPLRAACAVLERCGLFIGNDTGSAHLAATMRCPTVVVSRHPANGDPDHANSPVRFAPRRPQVRVLQPASGIGECAASCRSREPHCILQVSVDEVLSAAIELLPHGEPAFAGVVPRGLVLPVTGPTPADVARPA